MNLRLTQIATAITLFTISLPIMAQEAPDKGAANKEALNKEAPNKDPASKAAAAEAAALKAVKPAAGKTEIATVEIKGSNQDADPRRDDTASKTVLNRDEILKYGDTNVFDVLKRAPGVTVIGNSIRMRGLGNGYTQILVNGERPPPGFSMDALTLRVAVSNALGEDTRTESSYQDALGTNQTWTNTPRSPRLQANLELKF